jgi:membrane protein DedA with SNARE-associated domain
VVDSFIDWLAGTPPVVLYAVIIVLSAVENIFPPVPADVAVALGAFLSHRGATSAPLVGVLCWAANAASASGMYFFARSHKDFVKRGWPSRILTPEAMAALEKAYERYGTAGIFVSRFLPGIRAAVTPFAGVVGLSPWRALWPAWLASAIWYAVIVVVGSVVGREWEHVKHIVETGSGALGAVGIVATIAIGVWLWKQSRRKKEARE